ncbi:MAG: AAA family ATPase [Proteobacteria bacterium]|nr:AAA family ATPase [Pseudomonadota bacterium]
MTNDWGDFNQAVEQQTSSGKKYNVEDIRSRMLTNIHAILRYLLPKGVFQADRFVVGDLQGNSGKSLVITVSGDKAGLWQDFSTGECGDLFTLWANIYGLDAKQNFSEVLQDIEGWIGGDYKDKYTKTADTKPIPPIDELGAFTGKWDYFDSQGKLIACVYRYDPEDGKKQFRPWDAKLRKYKAPIPRPLYNQPQMVTAKQVILVEGEKAAQALNNIGVCATTAMNGAKAPIDKTNWKPLTGKDVVIWPDKDKAGWEYAENVAMHLQHSGISSISILHPPDDKPEKWDAADAVSEGLDINQFLGSVTRSEIKTASSTSINLYDWIADKYDGDAPEQTFLVQDTFPMGMVSLLAAMGDTGKGMLTLNLALQVATGTAPATSVSPSPHAFGNSVKEFGTAVIFTAEDDKNEVHRRLERLDPHRIRSRKENRKKLLIIPLPSAGGVFPIVNSTKEGSEITKQYQEIYNQLVQIPDLKLVVFDPLSSFIHADVNSDPAAGSFATGILAALAYETGASLIIPHHMRKPTGGKSITTAEQARDAIRGTSALVDGVRLAYALWPAPEEVQMMIFKLLEEKSERNAVYQGAVVKANSPADRTIRTYLRNKTGLLVDVTQRLAEVKTPDEALKEMLIFSIARAARNGHPFTHTGGSGVFKQRNRLTQVLHGVGRHKLEKLVQSLMNERPPQIVKGKASGSTEDKWLDIPDGPFARGEGEFQHGADEVEI